MIKQITIEQARYTAHSLAVQLMSHDEPIPEFTTRYPGRLESCLNQPFIYVGGKPAYRFLYQRGALTFYLIIKDHPFANGNKRMAVMITMLFFYINGKWIDVSPQELYKIACDVAESGADEISKKVVIGVLEKFFKNHITLR